MRTFLIVSAFALVGMLVLSSEDPQQNAAQEDNRVLMHAVYFTLKDDSEAQKQRLIKLCDEYLKDHEGSVGFGAGPRAKEFDREVNDQDHDVALFVVFENKAAHDRYQTHPRHLKFIELGKDNWKSVRVFDSYLDVKSKPN